MLSSEQVSDLRPVCTTRRTPTRAVVGPVAKAGSASKAGYRRSSLLFRFSPQCCFIIKLFCNILLATKWPCRANSSFRRGASDGSFVSRRVLPYVIRGYMCCCQYSQLLSRTFERDCANFVHEDGELWRVADLISYGRATPSTDTLLLRASPKVGNFCQGRASIF